MSTQKTIPRRQPAASETTRVEMLRHRRGGKPGKRGDLVAREEPLEIRVRGRSIAVTMRTPGHDRELAAGFLLSEGLIRGPDDVIEFGPCLKSGAPQNTLNVFLSPAVELDLERLTRHVFATSSCGLCGKATIEAVHQHFPPIASNVAVPFGLLAALPERMLAAQRTFADTGGLHAAAIFDAQGHLVVLREDIGRHNAVDKVLGYGLLSEKFPFDSHVLLVSGRASFEIVQKALAARIPIVCALSAPSSLAVELALDSGQTLVGFLRGETMNIYSRPERVVDGRVSNIRRAPKRNGHLGKILSFDNEGED